MLHFKVKCPNLLGFAAHKIEPGTQGSIIIKSPLLTSDDIFFHKIITEIERVILHQVPDYNPSWITKFLIVMHPDETADVYLNDFTEIQKSKVNRSIKKGEKIYLKDITDIVSLKFKDIAFQQDDAVIYCTKIGWKFGLYFNLERTLDVNEMSLELGLLKKELMFAKASDDLAFELGKSKQEVIIMTEGKTDWKHLEAAKEALAINLPIKIHEIDEDRGCDESYAMCEHLSKVHFLSKKVIFLFDDDVPNLVKKLNKKTEKGKDYQDWGNGVYSFLLPRPLYRKNHKGISIEFLYSDDEIKTEDEKQRRLYLSSEFKEKTGKHSSFSCNYGNPKKLKNKTSSDTCFIIDSEVYDENEDNIALSKENFANNILLGAESFKTIDFSGFNPVFEIIEKIINDSK